MKTAFEQVSFQLNIAVVKECERNKEQWIQCLRHRNLLSFVPFALFHDDFGWITRTHERHIRDANDVQLYARLY